MPLLDLSTLAIPHIAPGSVQQYQYYILTEPETFDWQFQDFIYIPQSKKEAGIVCAIEIVTCQTDVLKLFDDKGIMTIIPLHNESAYGTPIYTRLMAPYELENWECPENFFWSKIQAEETLERIKNQCGHVIGYNQKEFSIIKPHGLFDNIMQDLKANR